MPVLDAPQIALVGDSHCALGWTQRVVQRAAADGVHHLLQLGDFGYWPRFASGRHFLAELDKELGRAGSTLWFLRGNHEDHDILLRHEPGGDGLVHISDHIQFIPDGAVIEWAGRRILALGGAPSIDADGRVPGVDWFPTEVLSRGGFDAAHAAGPVDIVVSHDCPAGVDLGYLVGWEPGDLHRAVLARIAQVARPALWVHGHYHRRRTADVAFGGLACRVESLGHNHLADSVIYLQPDLAVRIPSAAILPTGRDEPEM